MDATSLKLLIGVIGATISFCWGAWSWRATRRDKLASEERENDRLVQTRRIEATRPFLEKQLMLYAEAARV